MTPRTDQYAAPAAGRIVICDPDPELAASMAQMLRQENMEVRVAHCGSRLLSQIHNGEVDVVVTDLLMPDMNAAELLTSLNNVRNRSFTTVVHSYHDAAPELLRKGVDVFLKRPVSKEELISTVQLALQQRAAGGHTVLILNNTAMDTPRITSLLRDAGHTPVVAGSMKEAVALACDHAVGVILLSSDSLSAKWAELNHFRITARDTTRFLILCDAVRKHERKLEEEHHATAVPYRRGKEETVLDAIMTTTNPLAEEITR